MDERLERLEALLRETAEAHHEAFIETDGADPEWPLWYAEHMGEEANRLLGASATRSQWVFLLVGLEHEEALSAPGADWAAAYARSLDARYP